MEQLLEIAQNNWGSITAILGVLYYLAEKLIQNSKLTQNDITSDIVLKPLFKAIANIIKNVGHKQ